MGSEDARSVLGALLQSPSWAVRYLDLMKLIRPGEFHKQVAAITECPPELENARRRINEALKRLGAPLRVRAIRNIGLRVAQTIVRRCRGKGKCP